MSYAWMIDVSHLAPRERGICGPRAAPDALINELMKGNGTQFRMRDDDGELCYEGRIVGKYEGFEPLDDFGRPNAGMTRIEYLKGKWEEL